MNRALPVLLLFCLQSFAASIQIPFGTNNPANPWWVVTPSATAIQGWQGWQTVDTNFAQIDGEIASLAGSQADAQTNSVLNSFRLAVWSTNCLPIYQQTFFELPTIVTNFAGATFTFSNVAAAFIFSTDGSNWQFGAENLLTNVPVWLAFTNTAPSDLIGFNGNVVISNLTLYTQLRPDLCGRSNSVIGQTFQVGSPVSPADATPKSYVDALLQTPAWLQGGAPINLNGYPLNITPNFRLVGDEMNLASSLLHLEFVGGDVFTIKGPAAIFTVITNWAFVTNWVTLNIPTNGITSPIFPQYTTQLGVAAWLIVTNFTSTYPVSSNGCYTLHFPYPDPRTAFIRCAYYPVGATLMAIQVDLQKLPFTVTNSTDSTSGSGAGLIRWYTNYLYISTGTNQWKRAALASW
jgi:hypothetical protein